MIKSRDSNDYLHTEVILSKISEYDIFRHYCSNFKELGVKFCSDLRKDTRPSCSIVEWNGKLLYKDFANLDHTFNCFSYVMYKYGLDFISSLETISRDFGLKLVSNSRDAVARTYESNLVVHHKRKSRISIRTRPWNSNDAKFWKKYGISKKSLIRYNVVPIDYFWINEYRFKVKDVGYAYKFKDGYKIYQPYDLDNKWYSNIGIDTVQGYSQLPSNGDVVFITSSLKDVLTLSNMGYIAIALQSEMVMPPKDLVVDLRIKFCNIVLLYDNDYNSELNPGQSMANRICQEYDFLNFLIPDSYGSKDISDLVANHGLGNAKSLISNTLSQWIAEKRLIPY